MDGEEVSWSVGYGPRTRARLLRPAGAAGPLPGVLALHGHDAYKYHGLEKISDGPNGMVPEVAPLREAMYESRAFANELARRGFAVLVPDVFLWGSRRFEIDTMPSGPPPPPEERWVAAEDSGDPTDLRWYNRRAARHEHVIAKYCALLGVSLAGIVAYEDRIAAAYLAARPEVRPGPLGCVGLSGGGCRAALLQATSNRIGAAVIVGMMTTHAALLDRHVADHTWMFFPPGLPWQGDWPDLAASRAPSPLLVQYLLDDALFPLTGMHAAHQRLTQRYERAGAPHAYIGDFSPVHTGSTPACRTEHSPNSAAGWDEDAPATALHDPLIGRSGSGPSADTRAPRAPAAQSTLPPSPHRWFELGVGNGHGEEDTGPQPA